jgi:hypothetical protein
LKYFIQTKDAQGNFVEKLTVFCGGNLKFAQEVLARTEGCRRFFVRELMQYDPASGKVEEVDKLEFKDRIDGPCTLSPRFTQALNRWGKEDNKVIHALLTPASLTNAEIDYVDIGESEFTYLLDGRPPVYDSQGQPYSGDNRQSGRPARVARKMLTKEALGELKDPDFEAFATIVNTDLKKHESVQLVEGEDIRFWYHERNQQSGSFASCMRYAQCQPYLNIYAHNPEQIKMAVLFNPAGKLIGRAIVWKLDDGNTFMDRMYGSDVVQKRLEKFAHENGIYTRQWGSSSMELYNGKDRIDGSTLFCTVANPTHTDYPHMDTMCFIDTDTGRITNNGKRKWTRAARGTSGSYSTPPPGTIWPKADGGPDIFEHPCKNCSANIAMDDIERCFSRVRPGSRTGQMEWYCPTCSDRYFPVCKQCHERPEDGQYSNTPDGDKMCNRCWNQRFYHCRMCSQISRVSSSHYERNGSRWCNACADRKRYYCYCTECNGSGTTIYSAREFDIDRNLAAKCIAAGRSQPTYDRTEDEDDWVEEYDEDDEE